MTPGTESDLASPPSTPGPAAGHAPASHAAAAGRPPTASDDKQGFRLGALVLCVLSAILYYPTLEYELVYDDWFLITPAQNESMRGLDESLSPAFQLFAREYWDGVNPDQIEALRTRGQALYRPLTLFVWAVVQHYHGPAVANNALPYHMINLLLNMWVVYLMFSVIRRMFGSTRVAFISTLLYAVHPLHSEAVAYVAGLSDIMAAATVLLGLSFWLKATADRTRLAKGAYIGLLLTMFIGLLAKEAAVLVLAAVLLSDLVRSARGVGPSGRQRLAVYGGLIVVLGLHLLTRWQFTEFTAPNPELIGRMDNVLAAEPFDIRAMNAFKLLSKYTWLVLWPAEMSVDYSFAAITVSRSWGMAGPLAGVLLVGMLVLVGLVRMRRWPAFAWGLLFFAGTAAFTSNIVPIGTVFAERLMYTPTIGACLALGALLAWLVSPSGKPGAAMNPVGLLIVVLAAGALGMRTWERNQDFETSIGLFEAAAEVVPKSGKVHYQLGSVYATRQLYDQALSRFEKALECDPQFLQAAIRLGDVYSAKKVWDKATLAYSDILRSLQAAANQGQTVGDPVHLAAVRAMVLTKRAQAKKQAGDIAGATADLNEASTIDAEGIGSDLALAELLQGQEKWAESVPVIRKALREMDGNVRLLTMLTRAAAATADVQSYEEALAGLDATEKGKPVALAMRAEVMYENAAVSRDPAARERAMDMFEEAIRLDDSLATPFFFRGRFYVETQRAFFEAINEYDRALENEPDFMPALLYKSLAQMQLQKYEDALATLKQLEAVNPGQAVYALEGETYFMLGDIEKMEQAYAKVRELGEEPVQTIVLRAKAFDDSGEPEKALDILDQAFVSPDFASSPEPWKQKGVLLLELGRADEALAAFDQQRTLLAVAQQSLTEVDPEVYYVGINRARCLMQLDRDLEAAGELEAAELQLGNLDPGTSLWANVRASLLRQQAMLRLRAGGPFYDPAQADALCDDGIELTRRRFPPFFELSIEARIQAGDLPGAAQRAREAEDALGRLGLTYFGTAAAALEQASANRAAAITALQAAGQASEQAFLLRLAELLQGN